ncbi:MAG: hypothetical protein ACC653_08945 [Gammaproteobacteria bacterium]
MKIDTHPSTENIIAFLEAPDSLDYNDLELHLASCSGCRLQVNRLSQLQKDLLSPDFVQQQLLQGITSKKSTEFETALSEGKIENYVDNKLDKNEYQNIDELVKNDPQALKAALHYASHKSAMQRELAEPAIDVAKRTNYFDLVALFKKYFTMTIPAWVMIPATGFASIVLVIFMNSQLVNQQDAIKIASYQDNAVIQYSGKNTPPGIGFFSNAFTKVKPFNNVKIEVVGESTLKLNWPKIENAVSYSIRVQKIDKGQNIIVGELTGPNTTVEFKDIKLDKQVRYQWILTGKTTANETFYSSGGFVRY